MKNELKCCPFCGARGTVRKKINLKAWIVECSNVKCPASYMIGYDYDSKEEAIEAWNRRVQNDEID